MQENVSNILTIYDSGNKMRSKKTSTYLDWGYLKGGLIYKNLSFNSHSLVATMMDEDWNDGLERVKEKEEQGDNWKEKEQV